MTYISNLEEARDNAASTLASITANPKPNYTVNGQSVQWSEYSKMLTNLIDRLNKLIAAGEVDEEPFEIISRGIT